MGHSKLSDTNQWLNRICYLRDNEHCDCYRGSCHRKVYSYPSFPHHHPEIGAEMKSPGPLHLIKGFSLNDHQNKTGNSEEQKKLILEGRLTLFSLQREKI